MTTTERIANAIKHILEEDRRADRERIAELERDAAHMQLRVDLALSGDNELHAIIDDLNRQLDEAHKKVAALAAQNNRLHAANAVLARERSEDEPAPVVEEQGPWVVYDDPDDLRVNPYMGLNGWGRINDGIGPFVDRSHAVAALNGWMMGGYSRAPRVITLAEARAIEAKRG
jgi:hypothetical protein